MTKEDLDIANIELLEKLDLVVDGKIMKENLQKLDKDYNWLVKQVEPYEIMPEDALIVTIDGKGNFFVKLNKSKF